jgi:hypothetical protein
MRILLAAVVLVLLLPAVSEARCRPRGAEELARTETVLVTKRRDGVTQVCHRSARRVTALDQRITDALEDPVILARLLAVEGRYVAYAWYWSGWKNANRAMMRVLDAKRGRVVTSVGAHTGAEYDDDLQKSRDVRDVVLDRQGAVAWLFARPAPDPAVELRYAARGARRESMLLAASPTLETGSLALSARYVFWRDGASAESAPRP